MSVIQRFSAVDKAILVSTGNSLVVCGSTTAPDINTSNLIKPDGSNTRDWTQAGSTAQINILSNSTILYAELTWYSTVFSNVSGALDLRSIQDNPITFVTSQGSYFIAPLYTESYTAISGTVDRYRSADVTTYIQASMGGSYTVSNVPISVPSTGLSNSIGGWCLTIAYRNNAFLPQKISYSSGIYAVTPSTPLQITTTGFTTGANTGSLKGYLSFVCANGRPLDGIEYVYAGPSFAQLSNIGNSVLSPNPNPGTAPNNPGNRFFSGNINVSDQLSSSNGLLNINGTNGINNNDGFVPTQNLGARNKWDITNVDISNTLIFNQNFLAEQITEEVDGDGIQLIALGTQILTKAPNIIATLEAYDIDGDLEYNVEVGESQVYAIHIKNDGDVVANNFIVSAVLNSATTFVPGSVIINGVSNPTANISNGINLGTINAKGGSTILFTVVVNSVPPGGLLYQNANYRYQFISGIDAITNSGTTNTIKLIVQEGNLSITKAASNTTTTINDIITYTISIKNIGTELATKLFFQDKIDSSCSFLAGTVVIDGITYSQYNPVAGFNLPNLAVDASTQIVFQTKVNSLPPSTTVTNISCISFAYTFNQYDYLREKTIFSNTTSIQVQFIDIIGERCNNNDYPKVGDIVTYTLSLTNMGNIPANNVSVLEPAIPGATFVNGSVTINGISEPTLNPFTGFNLTSPINPQQTTDVEYKVLINSINPENLIENIAKVPFKYQITPGGAIISTEKNSNVVNTIANYVCMNIVKSVDKSCSELGSILYYTVEVSNMGNINATSTEFVDILQSNLSFIAGTVAINGIPYPSYNPTQGFTLGTICPEDVIDITFQAIIVTLPNPNVVNNQASLVYSYQPDPNGSVLTNTITSNIVQTYVNEVKYSIVKSVNKSYGQIGDTLIYTTTITNTGTVELTNMKFADYLGVYISFVQGSVFIDGINYPSLNPESQFSIGNMNPGDVKTVSFEVTIVANTPLGYIPNISDVTLTYKQCSDSPIVTKTVYSNEVRTNVLYALIVLTKYVDKSYATVGETLTYTFSAINNGNATAINTLFTDIIQSQASFVIGSVLVNGISKPNFNPQTGFTLGDIAAGQAITVEFKVIVNSLPTPNTINNRATTSYSYYVDPAQQPISKTVNSNTVTTVINTYSATLTKAVNKAYATVGDVLDYTITANNSGTVTLTNVNFIDLIPSGATFVDGSVAVDGISKPTANPNTGFGITNILPGGSVVIMFKVTVTSVPTTSQIDNNANLTFKYQLSPTSSVIDGSLTSNTVTTNVNIVELTNTMSVSKLYATVPDTLTYTSVIANTGNISVENTKFIDNIVEQLTFVEGSVKINGVPYPNYNPNVGFTLGTIVAGSEVIVTFEVLVESLPLNGYVTNFSVVNYQYKINPTEPYISSSATSNTVITYIKLGDLTIIKSADRTIVRLTNVITYNFVISNTGNTILENLFFKDTVQSQSSFNIGTVFVNGVNRPTFDPNIGFNLDNIPIGQQATISFQVTVNIIPPNNVLLNSGDITYSYYVDPLASPIANTETSNTTTVDVFDTIVSANKIVDKSIAKLGDTLSFTISIINQGSVVAENVFFKDILDSNISFVNNSVFVNGVQKIGVNPNTGFNLDNIPAGETTTVNFLVTIISRPANNIIPNFATINYSYTLGTEVIQATINTNTTETFVAIGELTVTKVVDKIYAKVGDTLAYTVLINNTGSVDATNISFQDVISTNASFNTGTVVVDGIPKSTFNPNIGFELSDLTPDQSHIVTFSVNVISLPQSGELDNTANVTFTYKLSPTDTPVTKTTSSNTVITFIKVGELVVTKSVDKAYATIGNTLNYTITINNTGNATCFNVFFQDIIQSNASFVTGSVKINGRTYGDYNPNTGFNLEDILGFATTVVTFSVTVQTLPTDYTIYDFATVSYKYYIDPNNQPISIQGQSNTVNTVINVGSLIATKSVSKAYATIGDVLTYTISVLNAGNTLAKFVNFRDVLPLGITFVTGTVKINGVSYQTYDPYSSFTLGNIIPGDNIIVTFDAAVTSLPNPSLTTNTANITFSYKIDPTGPDIPVIVDSNTVTTQINVGSLSLAKSVDKAYAVIGDILTYTVVVTNNGNVNAENVFFTDNLQSDITFNTGSVKIDGTAYPNYDPEVGFNLGNIEPLASVTVIFTVTVNESPTQNSILNFAVATFSYKIDPNGQLYTNSAQSNTVTTLVSAANLAVTKTVDKSYATLQDVLNYDITVKNTGNTAISQLVFTDYISNGAVFKVGTVLINGISYPTYNPTVGFNLPINLEAGNTCLVQFQATVTSIPTPPQVTNYAVVNGVYYIEPLGPSYPITATSNTVTTNINVGSLSDIKEVDKTYAKVNDTIIYTSTITNTGNVNLINLFFTDVLQPGLTFVSGTVSIDGTVFPALDPVTGFALPNLIPTQSVIVVFSAKITSLPTPNYVTNTSNINYSYKIDPSGTVITKNQTSNTVITNIVLGQLSIVKVVDKSIATIGEELTYTITLTNTGNVTDSNVFFQDILSEGAIFKIGSVKVNNISQPTYDPITGFSLVDIGIGNVVTVAFVVTVSSVSTVNQITNQAKASFEFIVDPQQPPYSETSFSNIVTTIIAYGNLNVTKAVNKQYATIGEELTYTITIVNTGNIDVTDVVFQDPTPNNTVFVTGSVTVNGVAYPLYNPEAGFNLGTMTPGQIITVVYRVKILDLC